MLLPLARVLLTAAVICGCRGWVCAWEPSDHSQPGIVVAMNGGVAQLPDPAKDSIEGKWQREEVLRHARGKHSVEDASSDYVAMVTVPLLLLAAVVALTRLKDF